MKIKENIDLIMSYWINTFCSIPNIKLEPNDFNEFCKELNEHQFYALNESNFSMPTHLHKIRVRSVIYRTTRVWTEYEINQ